QVREGSSARNLDTLLPGIVDGRLGAWCLCSDDVHPDDLIARGHIEGLLRRVVAVGVPAARAVRHASLVAHRHCGLRDRGGIAPGYRADLAVVEDVSQFRVQMVFKDGVLVARDGRCLTEAATRTDERFANTVHVRPLDESAFRLPLKSATCPAIGINPGQLVTRRASCQVRCSAGSWAFDPELYVAPIASLE